MKRNWNAWVWAGFGLTLFSAFSYILYFVRFPITRDVPWVSLLLFIVAVWLFAVGLKRAYGQPERYRGRVSGVILSALSLSLMGLFCWGVLFLTKGLPASSDAPRAGQHAPEFTLPGAGGKPVALSGLLKTHKGALLIFYRGYW
ncbi:MAG TPA: hypothetical protein VNH83_24870 [Bryobacteraceae bacterium]|nr:hypothetical protein [Bryobacteraceae bacterium]